MKFTLSSLFLAIALASFSQEKEWKVQDINKDGFKDSITVYYDGGSGFGGNHLEIINGKTKQILAFDTYACFCRTKQTLLFPPEFLEAENAAFFERMKKDLLGDFRASADPALKWIIDGELSQKIEEGDTGLFQSTFRYAPLWLDSIPQLTRYFLPISSDTLRRIFTTDTDTPEYFSDEVLVGGVVMNIVVLGPMRSQATLTMEQTEFYTKSHAVIARRGGKWSYVFVTDSDLTGAPDKLRWSSVTQIFVQGDYLVVRQSRPTGDADHFFIINYMTGLCGELRETCSEQAEILLKDGYFLLNGEKTFSFGSIAVALEEKFQN